MIQYFCCLTDIALLASTRGCRRTRLRAQLVGTVYGQALKRLHYKIHVFLFFLFLRSQNEVKYKIFTATPARCKMCSGSGRSLLSLSVSLSFLLAILHSPFAASVAGVCLMSSLLYEIYHRNWNWPRLLASVSSFKPKLLEESPSQGQAEPKSWNCFNSGYKLMGKEYATFLKLGINYWSWTLSLD